VRRTYRVYRGRQEEGAVSICREAWERRDRLDTQTKDEILQLATPWGAEKVRSRKSLKSRAERKGERGDRLI